MGGSCIRVLNLVIVAIALLVLTACGPSDKVVAPMSRTETLQTPQEPVEGEGWYSLFSAAKQAPLPSDGGYHNPIPPRNPLWVAFLPNLAIIMLPVP